MQHIGNIFRSFFTGSTNENNATGQNTATISTPNHNFSSSVFDPSNNNSQSLENRVSHIDFSELDTDLGDPFGKGLDAWVEKGGSPEYRNTRQEAATQIRKNYQEQLDYNSRNFDLSHLNLESLPAALFDLKEIQVLYLSNNLLSTLSPRIGELKKLERLYVFKNRLTELPSQIGDLSELESFYISFNNITRLPEEISNIVNLREIHIFFNPLKEIYECEKFINITIYLDRDQMKKFLCENEEKILELETNGVVVQSNLGFDGVYSVEKKSEFFEAIKEQEKASAEMRLGDIKNAAET